MFITPHVIAQTSPLRVLALYRADDITTGPFSRVDATPDGTYYLGETIYINMEFRSPIRIEISRNDYPRLQLNTGRFAILLDVVRGNKLFFEYTVQAGDMTDDLDYASTDAFTLGGARLTCCRRQPYRTHATAPGAPPSLASNTNFVINGVPRVRVTGVDRDPDITLGNFDFVNDTPNGTYSIGDIIYIGMTFSRQVFVSNLSGNTPQLQLNTGSAAPYVTLHGNRVMVFEYTVQAGDNTDDLDYVSTDAFTLGGATISIPTIGRSVILTLPAPGGPDSLANNTDFVIDGVAPTVEITTTDTSPRNAPFTATFTFSEDVTGFEQGDIIVTNGTDSDFVMTNPAFYTA